MLYLVLNPIAGNGKSLEAFATVKAVLKERDIPYFSDETSNPGQAVELVRKAADDGHSPIVVFGGDGTVREAASALMGTATPLGIIPCGTGNDLSRALHIPENPVAAINLVLSGEGRWMDAAKVNDELFFNIAGFGFDVDVLDYTEIYKKKMKNGSLAYFCGLMHAILGLKTRQTIITTPDGTMEKDVLLMVAANGTHFGGGMRIAPQADPFDGLLDICVIHDVNRLSLLGLLTNLKSGNHIKSKKHVTYFRTTEITATCDPVSRLDVDGEVMPDTPAVFRVLPKSLCVIAGD